MGQVVLATCLASADASASGRCPRVASSASPIASSEPGLPDGNTCRVSRCLSKEAQGSQSDINLFVEARLL